MLRGGTGLCKEPARSLSSGRLPTSISLEAERQRSVIAKSRSCKIAAALGSPFFPAWCIFLVTLREQDLLPISGTSFARDASRGTLADATDDISIGAGWCSLNALRRSRVAYPWLLARVGHSSLGRGQHESLKFALVHRSS